MYRSEKEDIRTDISLLRELMNLEIDGYNISRQQHMKSVEGLKKLVRNKLAQYNKRKEEENNMHYSSDGESCYYKIWFDSHFTEEEKREYIEDNWVHVNYPWSPTGLWFTSHIVVCNVNGSENGKAVAYHFMGLDC